LGDGTERQQIRSRYLMRHPKSALYADFADFAFWMIEPERASLNGGFGKAYALTPKDMLTSAPEIEDLAAMEAGAVQHMNADHADAIDRMAARAGGEKTGWRLSSLDPEGLDLSRGDHAVRVWFARPLASAGELRPAIIDLSKA
jgi:putative heme iron utilization protein